MVIKVKNDVIIVGAGASGMVAAIVAARRGKKVLIIDRMAKAGKKIFATGNGKCNYTNTNYDYDSYRGNDISIVEDVLKVVTCKFVDYKHAFAGALCFFLFIA